MFEERPSQELTTRIQAYQQFRELFASAPIRLMSRVVSWMRCQGFPDRALAIGDLDWRTVPADDPEDPGLRQEWGHLLESSAAHVEGWLCQLSDHPMGYNLDSIGYPALTHAWSAMWRHQVGLEFRNETGAAPEVFLFHGGNQALQAALLAVAEARRERTGDGRPATVLVPIPSFSCPLDQMALQGMRVVLLPPTEADMDPHVADLESVPGDVDIDGVYLMPVTNPTGRTVPTTRLRGFVTAVLDRWPHAGILVDSVYVRLHPEHEQLLAWFTEDERFAGSVVFIDSLSKTHGVTGLRSGAVLTRASRFAGGITRYAQNVMAGPSNLMQAMTLALLGPYVTGDEELQLSRLRLQLRIGRHMQRRRRLMLERAFAKHGRFLDGEQPVVPDQETYDWEGSLYAVLRLSDQCLAAADRYEVSPTVAFYFKTGYAGVPLSGFCGNPNLFRHGLVVNADSERLASFRREAERYVRLSFGMTPPPE